MNYLIIQFLMESNKKINANQQLCYFKQCLQQSKFDSKNSMKDSKQSSADIGLQQQNYIFKAWKDLKQSIFNVLYVLLDGEDNDQAQQPMLGLIFQSGLDYFQMLAFPFDRTIMSAWNGGQTLQNVSNLFSKLNIMTYLPGVSFNTFLIMLYALIMMIILVIIDIIYVSYSFSKKRFRFTWPLVILAKLVPLFVTVFFLPITETLLSVVNCASSESDQYQVMNSYPDVICWKGWHLFHAAITLLFVTLFVFISSIVALALFQPRMTSKKLTARQNSTGQIVFIMNKIICQLIFSFNPFKDQWIYSVILFGLSGWLYWTYNMSDPFYNKKVSKFFRIVSSYYFWTNFMLLISQLLSPFGFNGGLVIWISGLPFIGIIIGFQHKSNIDQLFSFNLKFKSGEQLQGHLRYVLQLLQSQQQDKNSYMLITGYIQKHKEICVQDDCPLKFMKKINKLTSQKQDLNQKFLLQIERMYKSGIKKYPDCTRLRISFAFFQLQRLKNKNKAYEQFSFAIKTDPSFQQEFIIYRFKKIIRQNLQNNQKQQSSSDLIEIIRFENHISLCQQAMIRSARLHKDFWTELKQQTPDLKKLNGIGSKITKTINVVKQNYEQISKINNSVPQVIYCYSLYLLLVIKDNIEGQRLLQISKKVYLEKISVSSKKEEAQKQEQIKDQITQQALITVSCKKGSVGKVINLNSLFSELTGYQRQQITQRNYERLLPQIFKDLHEQKVKQWLQAEQQQQRGYYINNHQHGYLKLKSGFVLPIQYEVLYKESASQIFTVVFKNVSNYRNCCHLILDANCIIRDCSILGYVYFGLDKWVLNQIQVSIEEFFGIDNFESLQQIHEQNSFEHKIIFKKRQINCILHIKKIQMKFRPNIEHTNTISKTNTKISNQKTINFNKGQQLLGYYLRIVIKTNDTFENRSNQNDQSFEQLNDGQMSNITSEANNDIMELYEDPNIYDILISSLAETKTKQEKAIRFQLKYKIKTMRLLNNQIKMVYDQNNNIDFDNNDHDEQEDEDMQILKLNDDRYQEKIRSAINTKLQHREVVNLRFVGILFAFFAILVTTLEMVLSVGIFEAYSKRSQNLQNIVYESNQLSKYMTASLDIQQNITDNTTFYNQLHVKNLQSHKVNIQSDIEVEINLSKQKKQKLLIKDAFMYFYSRLNQYFKVNGNININILYLNYFLALYPAIQQMNMENAKLTQINKIVIISLFFLALLFSSLFFVFWVFIRLKINKKKTDILLWFLDIPISYVAFLGQNCDNYLKKFVSIKQIMNKGLKIQDNSYFEDYKQEHGKQQEIQQQQKARKSLILKQRKLTFFSRLNCQQLKMSWVLIFGMFYSVIALSQIITLKNYENFLINQWKFSGRSILWSNYIHFSMILINKGVSHLNGFDIEEFKVKNLAKFQNTMSDINLHNFNSEILSKYNNPSFEQIVSSYSSVYFSDICHYLNENNNDCGKIVDSSLRGGYRVYSMFIRNNDQTCANQIRQANQKYGSRAILSMINIWKSTMKQQVQKAVSLVSILYYIYIFAGMISFFVAWLIYLVKVNRQINQAIRMLNMIPFKLLSSSRKQTRNFIVWIIRQANKKKHELQ